MGAAQQAEGSGETPKAMRPYAALALLVLPACGAGAASEPPARVEIVNYAFAPREVTVSKGSTVTWTERDEDLAGKGAHNVEGDGFRSALLAKGAEFTFTFERPGRFVYRCGIHNYMTGTVTVEP